MSELAGAHEDHSREERWRQDRELIVRYRATRGRSKRERDRAFEPIVARFGPMVLGFCAARLDSDPDAAQQAAMDTFTDAYTSLYTLEEPRAAVSFLQKIAYRKVITHYKKAAKRRQEHPSADLGEHLERNLVRDGLRRPEPDIGFTARVEELRRLLDELVRTLSPEVQRTYDLSFRQDLTAAEVAQELEVSTPDASRRIHKHRKILLEALCITFLVHGGKGCDVFTKEAAGHRGRVPPPALRRKVASHYRDCEECRRQCRECIFWWTPGLVPVLFAPDLQREVMGRIKLVADTRTLDTGGDGQSPRDAAESPHGAAPGRRLRLRLRDGRRASAARVPGRRPSARRSPAGSGRDGGKWGPVAAVLLVGALLVGVMALGGAFRRSDIGALVKEPFAPEPSVMSDGPGRSDGTGPGAGDGRPGAGARDGDGPGQSTGPGSGGRGETGGSGSGDNGETGGTEGGGQGGAGGGNDDRQGHGGGEAGGDGNGDGSGGGSGGGSENGPGGSDGAGPSAPPEPPVAHTVGVVIKPGSDELVASYGVGVAVAGAPRPRCQGVNNPCLYEVPDGATVEVTLPAGSKALSWGGDAPCEPWQTTCAFTVTASRGIAVRLQYEPG